MHMRMGIESSTGICTGLQASVGESRVDMPAKVCEVLLIYC